MPWVWRAPAWPSPRTATHNASGGRPVPNISRAVSTKLLEEFHAGPLSQNTASESVTGTSAAIALVRSQAILRRLRHRTVRRMTGKRGVRLRPAQGGVDERAEEPLAGRACDEVRVRSRTCRHGTGLWWLLARLL